MVAMCKTATNSAGRIEKTAKRSEGNQDLCQQIDVVRVIGSSKHDVASNPVNEMADRKAPGPPAGDLGGS